MKTEHRLLYDIDKALSSFAGLWSPKLHAYPRVQVSLMLRILSSKFTQGYKTGDCNRVQQPSLVSPPFLASYRTLRNC